MKKVFLLEDEPREIADFKKEILAIAPDAVFEIAGNVPEALSVLDRCRPGSFSLLVFDLMVPARGRLDSAVDRFNGLTAVRRAWQRGHSSGIFVVSQLGDSEAGLLERARLRDEGIQIENWLDKSNDFDVIKGSDYKAHFGKFLVDWDGIIQYLRDESGVQIVSESQKLLLARLVDFVEFDLGIAQGPLPALYLRGETGSGKTFWATRALRGIKDYVENQWRRPDMPRIKATSVVPLQDLLDHAGNENLGLLFGYRNASFNGRAGIWEDGPLIRATAYLSLHGQDVVRERNPDSLQVDRRLSGYFLGDELLSAPPGVQPTMIDVIDRALVMPAGAGGRPIPIGCGLVFTSNLRPELMGDTQAQRRGQLMDAFADRMHSVVDIPLVSSLELAEVRLLLADLHRRGSANEQVIAPAAVDELARYHDKHLLNMRVLRDIAAHAQRCGQRRITDQSVRAICAKLVAFEGTDVRGSGASDRPIADRVQLPAGVAESPLGSETDLGWPPSIGGGEWERALWAFGRIQETRGECIGNNLLDVAERLDLTPTTVLALLIVLKANEQAGRTSKEEIAEWLKLRSATDFRYRLRSLKNRFRWNVAGRSVEMQDLDRWGAVAAARLGKL